MADGGKVVATVLITLSQCAHVPRAGAERRGPVQQAVPCRQEGEGGGEDGGQAQSDEALFSQLCPAENRGEGLGEGERRRERGRT